MDGGEHGDAVHQRRGFQTDLGLSGCVGRTKHGAAGRHDAVSPIIPWEVAMKGRP
jgi:hypothetical protein